MKKKLAEKELLEGITPDSAHSDELATCSWEEMELELSENEYQTALKRIESLFDVAGLGTPEGDELDRLIALAEEYRKSTSPFESFNCINSD